jgi:hypothetical protein
VSENVLVVVIYVIVVDVDVDVTAAPSKTPAPAPTPHGSQRNTDPERNRCSGVISRGRIVNQGIRIDRRTEDDGWIVRGNVNHLGTGWFNHDNLLTAFDCLGFHFLLCAGF